MTELTIALNFVIIFLLVIAIVYGFILNGRINLIRNSGKELITLFRSFDDTILRAQNSVEDLKRVSGVISDGLQKKIDKAAIVIDDLDFLNEKGEKAADKLGMAVANFKKIEGRIPAEIMSNGKNILSAPMVKPPIPSKSAIPEKSLFPKGKKRALEDILEDVTGEKARAQIKIGVNNNKKAASANNRKDESADKRQFSIASALKALGYGE